jgi:hypothetical protein
MSKPKDPRFRTHIPESRWQQVVSVVIVLILVALWVASFLWR